MKVFVIKQKEIPHHAALSYPENCSENTSPNTLNSDLNNSSTTTPANEQIVTWTMFTLYHIALRSVTNCISDRVFVHT